MAKLYFKFGAMGSSKTAQALMTKFNYEEKDKRVLLIKPDTDTRDDMLVDGKVIAEVKSRIGLSAPAVAISSEQSVISLTDGYDVIICDECQFLTETQVDELKDIADNLDIPVLCFGLRSDFRTKLFPGSKRLFEIADSITEIKSVCSCGRKATVNARFDDRGHIVTEGEQVLIGGNERYEGLCYRCYRKLLGQKNN